MPEEFNGSKEGYEKTDAKLSVYAGFVAVLALLTIGAMVITVSIMRGMEKRAKLSGGQGQATPADLTRHTIEREPRLEAAPEAEREALTRPDFEHIEAYGVVSENPYRLHVPIDKAIELIASGQASYKIQPPGNPSPPATAGGQEPSGDAGEQ
jgi:hypothetical protein